MIEQTSSNRTARNGRVRRVTLSLRWRVALAFGLTALLISGVLGVVTVRLAAAYMLNQRQQAANVQASVNAQLLKTAIQSGSEGVDELLDGFTGDPGSAVALGAPGRWLTGGRPIDTDSLPRDVIASAMAGSADQRRIVANGVPALLVAVPVEPGNSVFLALFPLAEFERTYRFLTLVLASGVVAAGMIGVAVGRWASRRALRPLVQFNAAAGQVAAGDLRARLPRQADPDLRQIGETFNSTAAALEQRVARDNRFAADVSHELRSPLTTMANAIELLRHRRGQLPPTAVQAVDLLDAEVQRFQQVVLDLLEISSSDQTVDVRAWEHVDMAVLVANVAAAFPAVPAPVIGTPTPPAVFGDRRRLQRVVANLIDNAQLHGGGVTRLLVTGHDGGVRLEVEDAGPGVPDEFKEHVFQRFSRGGLAGTRGESGTGLGLALVAQHVRTHNGRSWVQDRPGGGAVFVVELPADSSFDQSRHQGGGL